MGSHPAYYPTWACRLVERYEGWRCARQEANEEGPSGLWLREDGGLMLPMNLRRASIRERLYVIGLGWRACHNVRLTLMMVRRYLRPSAQVCDYEEWRRNDA